MDQTSRGEGVKSKSGRSGRDTIMKIIIESSDFHHEVLCFLNKIGADIPVDWTMGNFGVRQRGRDWGL